jgi:hypothetical protein
MYAGVNSLDNTRGLGGQEGLAALTQLRILSLPDNQIRRVDSVSSCISLQVVDLSHNYIDDLLPLTLALPSCLRALNISNNPVGNITSVLHLSALSHLMHIFVSGCTFTLAACDAFIDLNPLFGALLPELITVDNANMTLVQRAHAKILSKHLSLLGNLSNEQAIPYLARNLADNISAASFGPASTAPANPFSDFTYEDDQKAGGLSKQSASAVVLQAPLLFSAPPQVPASVLPPASSLPHAKSVESLAHDLTRLKHKLASFASPVAVPLFQHSCIVPPGVQGTNSLHFPSQAISVPRAEAAAEPLSSSGILHRSASVISRSWRSFRSRCLLGSRHNMVTVTQKARTADPGTVSDSLIMKRLELLEKTVAVQLQVIEKLHATLQNVSAVRDSTPVWRIVADASAAATRIQSVWRGHIDREVVQVIHERKRYHNVTTDSLIARGYGAAATAAAVMISAFVRRKRAQDASKWMLLAISSQCLYRLVCNMGDRIHSIEQRLMCLEGSTN